MILSTRDRTIGWPRRPLVVGVVNLSPDSFSGDGFGDPAAALRRAAELVDAGADAIDVGAESARADREPVPESEEVGRLAPFLEGFADAVAGVGPADADQVFPPLLSVNTWRPGVVRQVLPAGVDLLNDMGGLPTPENAQLCAEHGTALLVMHIVGEPKVAHTGQRYRDVVDEVEQFFESKIAAALQAGLSPERIVLDPGIDFAKQRDDNLRLVRHLGRLARFRRPVLLPVSRKTVVGDVLGLPDARDRDAGTLGLLVAGALRGAHLFRVHNVAAAYRSLKVLEGLSRAV